MSSIIEENLERIKNLSDEKLKEEGILKINQYIPEIQEIYLAELKKRNLIDSSSNKKLDAELQKILENNDLQSYIPVLENEKLYSITDLETLTQEDYKELGISTLGERKKFLKLFSSEDDSYTVENLPALNGIPQYPNDDDIKNDKEIKNSDQKPEAIIINNNTGSGGSGAHTGLAGVLGGILGAAAVIIIGLIILSNESWSL